MKSLFVATLWISVLMTGFDSYAQVRLGVKAGVNASNAKYDFTSNDPLLGFQGGLMADINLSSKFSIQPALLFVTKGYSSELEFRNAKGKQTRTARTSFRTNYLEFPVLLLYKVKVSKSCQIYGGLGPYAGLGINGKSDIGRFLSSASSYRPQNILFGPKNGRPEGVYNRMDYGLSAAAGIEMGRIALAVNYSHGLTGIGPVSMYDIANFYNRSLGLTAGYWFGKTR